MPEFILHHGSAISSELSLLHEHCLPDKMWSLGSIESLLEAKSTYSLIAREGGANIGFSIFRIITDEAEIISMGVVEHLRERGFGQRLLEETQKQILKLGASKIFLEVATDNTVAIAMYSRKGFRKVGLRRGYYKMKDGRKVDAMVMGLNISLAQTRQ